MAVYTRRLGAFESTVTGGVEVCRAQPGVVTIMRDVVFTNMGAASATVRLIVVPLVRVGQFDLWVADGVASGGSFHIADLRQELVQDEFLLCSVSTQPWSIAVTGYVLQA